MSLLWGQSTEWASLDGSSGKRGAAIRAVLVIKDSGIGTAHAYSTAQPSEVSSVLVSKRVVPIAPDYWMCRRQGVLPNWSWLETLMHPRQWERWTVTGKELYWNLTDTALYFDCMGIEENRNTAVSSLFTLQGTVNEISARFLLDSGASCNFVNAEFLKNTGIPIPQPKGDGQVKLANGKTIMSLGTIQLKVKIGSYQETIHFKIIPLQMQYQVVLGKTWLEERNPNIDWKKGVLTVSREGKEYRLVSEKAASENCSKRINEQNSESGACVDLTRTQASEHSEEIKSYNRTRNGNEHRSAKLTGHKELGKVKPKLGGSKPLPGSTHDTSAGMRGSTSRYGEKECTPTLTPGGSKGNIGTMEITGTQAKRCIRKGCVAFLGLVRFNSEQDRLEDLQGIELCTIKEEPKEEPEVEKILQEFKDVFPEELPMQLPPKRNIEHRIEVIPGNDPPHRAPYRLSQDELEELRTQLEGYLAKGFIRPSVSPYGAPVLFVRKKNGTLRLCVDYRALNKITIKNRYPLPRIDDLFDRLRGAKYFTKLDLAQGYHQVRIAECDIEKTAFRTRYGHYEFVVLPFGLCNAPATFQNMMNSVLSPFLDYFVLVFLDDILIYSTTWEEHLEHLRKVLQKLRENKLYGRRAKCEFGQTSVEYLGHRIGSGTLEVCRDKIEKVLEWPRPTVVREIKSFVGMASFYRRFIRHFSRITQPLTDLTRQNIDSIWNARAEHAFETLKHALCTAPVLQLPDFERVFVVHTDASEVAIGAVLQQDFGRGLQPIAYESRKLNDAERRYSAYERELLAVVHACAIWKHYLRGREFILRTDHASLKYFLSQPYFSARQGRWLERLQEFHMQIEHVPGWRNLVADALSRMSELGKTKEAIRAQKAAAVARQVEIGAMWDMKTSVTGRVRIKRTYMSDPEGQALFVRLRDMEESEMQIGKRIFKLENCLIYSKSINPCEFVVDGEWKVWLPHTSDIRKEIMEECHDNESAGHKGFQRTKELVLRNFWWKGVSADIRDYVNSCPICQTVKVDRRRKLGQLQPLDVPTRK